MAQAQVLRYPGIEGRVALVTGANHGIGAATARVLAGYGARVLLNYWRLRDPPDPAVPETYRRDRAQDAFAVITAVRDAGGQAEAIEADLADPETAPMLFDLAERTLGPVEILINNASGWLQDTFKPDAVDRHGRRLEPVTVATIDRNLAVDARGAALLIAEFARRHIGRDSSWGRIIGLTSGGDHGFPEEVSYGAAKAALVNYTMSAAFELADYGVTANVVYPPVTDTGWISDEVRAFVRQSREHFHIAEPEDVSEVIAFLASDHARFITANVIQLR